MSARPQDSALDELRFLSGLHRVTEADLDARIAERKVITEAEPASVPTDPLTGWVIGLSSWELILWPVGFIVGVAGSALGWFA